MADTAETTERIQILLDLEKEAHDKAARASAREIARLEKSYDPLSRATIRYKKETESLAKALEDGVISEKRHAEMLRKVQDQYDETADKVVELERLKTIGLRSDNSMFASINRNKEAFRQLGYQVGDAAVQIQGGTSAMTAITQQGSQLLGVLGPFGAIAGAAFAVMAPLAAAFMASGEEAEKFSDRMKSLNDAVSAYNAAVASSVATTEELSEKYGRLSDEMRQTLDAITDQARVVALRELAEAAAAAAASLGGISDETDSEGNFLRSSDSYMRLIEDLGATTSEASKLSTEMNRLAEARGPEDTLKASIELRGTLQEIFGEYEAMPSAIQEQYAALLAVEGKAGEIGASMKEAAAAADGLTSVLHDAVDAMRELAGLEPGDDWLDFAINRAATLAGKLWEAAKARAEIHKKSVDADKKFQAYQYQQYGQGRMAGEALVRESDPENGGSGNIFDPRGRKKGTRGSKVKGGLFSASEQEIQSLGRRLDLIGKTKAETAALEAKWKLLDEAKKRGIDLDAQLAGSGETVREQIDRQSQAIGELTEQYDHAQERAHYFAQMQDTLKDGFIDAIVEGQGLSGVLENLAKSLAKAALQAALFGEGPFAGGGTGLIGSIFSGIFGGARASGGPVAPGKEYLVGENGPELFKPSTGGVIVPNGALAGQGSPRVDIYVRNTVDKDGNIRAFVEATSTSSATRVVSQYDRSLPDRMQQIQQSPRLR